MKASYSLSLPTQIKLLIVEEKQKLKKLPPDRVGANFDHSSSTSAGWLPSFGRVWNNGRRWQSRYEPSVRTPTCSPRGDLTLCAANLSFLFRHQFKTEAAARNKQQSHKGKKLMASWYISNYYKAQSQDNKSVTCYDPVTAFLRKQTNTLIWFNKVLFFKMYSWWDLFKKKKTTNQNYIPLWKGCVLCIGAPCSRIFTSSPVHASSPAAGASPPLVFLV